jgi:hypothetical protein
LSDPDTEWGRVDNPDLKSFAEISSLPCLVLLGEPGIGKTQTMKTDQERISNQIKANGDDVLTLDLHSYGSEDRLIKKLFESPKFTTWVEGTHRLYIFLDSLDECLLRIDNVAALLADEFKEYRDQANRLFLRINCRTAVWSTTLEKGLEQIFGENGVGIYELAPLRWADVREAAARERIESEDFLTEIWNKNLVPLVIKPVTLKFLLNIYRRYNGQFPENQTLCDLYLEGCKLDLTKLTGWQEADEATRKRIIEGAKKYIQQQSDIDYGWIGTNTYNRPAIGGCRALHLLLKESSDFLNTLSPEIWRKWSPVIIAAPCDNQHEDYYLEIVKRAYLNATQESINTLITLVEKENQEHDYLFVINRFDKCWDERLKLALLEKAKDLSLKPKCVGQLLEELLKQGLTEARDFAKSLISFPLPLVENEREKALIASRVLVENSDPSSWSFLWSLIQQDSSFGREVLELAADRYLHGIQLHLTETQLADLYLWLVHQYPYDEDPDYSDEVLAHSVTVRERMAHIKHSVLSQLKERGTLQACAEIQRIRQVFPDMTWLSKTLLDALSNMRRRTWQPPQPEQILQIASDSKRHLVQNGHQLLNVLLESLKRLELELQGETPAVRDLWDKVDDKKFKPVDENAFSDYVKRFLDKDLKSRGIIVNREVELRRNYGGSSGERTDIHVDAVVKKPNGELYDCITVIIEVKGCWHKDLNSAMEEQLVQRYLQDNSSKYGLYLVGWFNCNQWDDKDSRKKQAPKISIDQAREQFDRQAEQLSSPPNVVRACVLNTALR